MTLIRQSIPALYGGVSQQAAATRASNQCEEAINCYFTVADGVSKRPPLEILSELNDVALDTPGAVHTGARFFAHIPWPYHNGFVLEIPGDGTYTLYQVDDGQSITVENDTAQAYLTVGEDRFASDVFRAITVGSRIYIVNTDVTVALDDEASPGTISGSAQTLQSTALDSAGAGSIWRIQGDENNPYDTYYVKKEGTAFFEWLKPGVPYKFDVETMPHRIELITTDVDPLGVQAEFGTCPWKDNTVGDEKSNRAPSFVGKRIGGVFFAHDRLGFLAENGVSLSETGEHFNFWRTTVTDVLDTERIDVKVSSDGSSFLWWAQPLGKSIILFASERQFSLDGQPIFSPRTVSISQATAYPASKVCRPVASGPNIYFPSNTRTTTQLYEMFVQDDAVTNDAADVSAHVGNYVVGDVRELAVNNNFDLTLGRMRIDNTLYAYKSMWSGDQKVQSAWSKWSADVTFASVFPIDEYMYCVYYAIVGGRYRTYLGRFNLKHKTASDGYDSLGHVVHLDQLCSSMPTYNAGENRTYYSSPFPICDAYFKPKARMVYALGEFAGRVIRLDSAGPTPVFNGPDAFSFYVIGDHSSRGPVYLGTNYSMEFTFSEQYYNAGERAVLNARLQLRNMAVSFTDTGFFKARVKVRGAEEATSEVVTKLLNTYTARTVGDEYFQLNKPQIADGTYRFPVLGRSSDTTITLINDEYTPCHFVNAEWEGLVTTRTRR